MSASLEHNRRAVYTALSGVCQDRLLLERAFAFFETHFAAQTVFRVAQYIDGLMGQIGLNQEQRRALSIALYSALNKQDRELAEVPAMFRSAAPATTSASTPAASPAPAAVPTPTRAVALSGPAVVLAKILDEIVGAVTRASKLDDLLDSMQSAPLSSPTVNGPLAEWMQAGLTDTAKLAGSMQQRDHAAVVSFVYAALCDALGPVQADRILNRAITNADQLPEAAEWPARGLL